MANRDCIGIIFFPTNNQEVDSLYSLPSQCPDISTGISKNMLSPMCNECYLVISPNKGTQYRPQNAILLNIGTSKRYP